MPIGKRTFTPNEKAREYIADILETGRVSYGKYSKELEHKFAARHSSKYGVLSNSGTSSLQVAVQALKELRGWPDGAKVIVPSLTFVATLNVLLHNKLVPVLVDVDSVDYCIDCNLIEKAISPDTVAIMPVHLFGKMADMVSIRRLADKYNLSLIEDSCEAVMVQTEFNKIGSLSDVACFSFYMAHHVQAGVGGMSITNNAELATKMRSLVNHGMVCDTLDGLTFDPHRDFLFDSVGHSFRITEFEAALALSQIDDMWSNVDKRRAVAGSLSGLIIGYGLKLQVPVFDHEEFDHSFMMYPIVMLEGDKTEMRQHLLDRGIGTREMLPIINQPVYEGMWNPDDYPIAQWIGEYGFYIGLHPSMTNYDVWEIGEAIHDYYA